MNGYPSVILVSLYQTLHEKCRSIKFTRKQNYWTNLKKKEMKKLRHNKSG